LAVALLTLGFPLAQEVGLRAAEPVDYLREVKPILARNCSKCHGLQKQQAGLRLDTAKNVLQGSDSGPVVTPGKSQDSLLYKAVSGHPDVRAMPPRGPRLTREQIAVLQNWIDQGARALASEAEETTQSGGNHWAFQAPVRPKEPEVRNGAWCRNPIDRFIEARLEKERIAPSPEADRTTLIRRLSLDLLGLPPRPQEVDNFLRDTRPDAYERLVDRLLASPHYGERWGRHWLDAARYADSNGYTIDGPRSIWKYRDWVIDALNHDMPFDQFTIEQIAGDLLPGATTQQKIATGFQRNTLINEEGGTDPEQFRVEAVVDRVSTLGLVYLGLTVGCARCHDHKYDPISQREFYQLFAFYDSADEATLTLGPPEQVEATQKLRTELILLERKITTHTRDFALKQPEWEKRLTDVARGKLPSEVRAALAVPETERNPQQTRLLTIEYLKTDLVRPELERQYAEMKHRYTPLPTTLILRERSPPRTTHVHIRGDFLRKGVRVAPAVPAVLHPLPPVEKPSRLDLARWLVDPKNPLTARVTVNRLWEHYFSRGLVETENDLGSRGARPTHPELLDWLATAFVAPLPHSSPPGGGEGRARGWSLKAMHRLIVTSATYRQSSRRRPELEQRDPRNLLLARQSRLRLDAEVIRDQALAASGLLTAQIGGPSVFPPQPADVGSFTQAQKNWKASVGPERYRRGMYTYFWRSAPYPGLTVFDAPDSATSCTRRSRSNTPLQALTLANDQAFFEFAQELAARVLKESGPGDAERLHHAFRLCLAREPSATERRVLGDFLARQLAAVQARPQEAAEILPADLPPGTDRNQQVAWILVVRALLNLDEFITRE
jgi:hypothetical protein